MSFTIAGISLPLSPDRCVESNPAEYKSSSLPGRRPLIVSIGKKERKITMEGYLYSQGTSISTLLSTYIKPLRAYVYRHVTFSDPDNVYTGEYILEEFYTERTKDHPGAFRFRIILTQGSSVMQLIGIVLDPEYGPVGTTVAAYCTGYTPGGTLSLLFNGSSVTLSSNTADSKGNTNSSFIVPSSTTGDKTVKITDNSNRTTTVIFRVDAT